MFFGGRGWWFGIEELIHFMVFLDQIPSNLNMAATFYSAFRWKLTVPQARSGAVG